ncbi:unnamed protein product [Camellia sinensis]
MAGTIWNNCAPSKVQFFGWLACMARLKLLAFCKELVSLIGNANIVCVFCQNEIETVDHILLFCPFVWRLWSNIVKWWGLQWVLSGSVNGLLQWWFGCKMKKLEKKIWAVIPLAILWSIWKHRNDCVFSDIQPNWEELCDIVKVRVAMWIKASPMDAVFSVNDLVFNLQQVQYCIRNGG